jgi:hypothetical protein
MAEPSDKGGILGGVGLLNIEDSEDPLCMSAHVMQGKYYLEKLLGPVLALTSAR